MPRAEALGDDALLQMITVTSTEFARRLRTGRVGANDFTFALDPTGHRCPMGAHIRRVNPRNADLPPGGEGIVARLIRTLGLNAKSREQDLVASTRFHRVLRRGREYGVQGQWERRFDRVLRPPFDAVLRDPIARLATALIKSTRPRRPGARRRKAAP